MTWPDAEKPANALKMQPARTLLSGPDDILAHHVEGVHGLFGESKVPPVPALHFALLQPEQLRCGLACVDELASGVKEVEVVGGRGEYLVEHPCLPVHLR